MNAITILVRNDYRDIMDLNECFMSIQESIPETLEDTEIVIFHESNFEKFKKEIAIPVGNFPKIIFREITLQVPENLKEKFGEKILDFYPHPTHGNGPLGFGHPGFSIGYRSMCRFFAAEIFCTDTIKRAGYQYIMRLDTDSRFLKGNGESLFTWASKNQVAYSYVRSAIQWDNFKVIKYFKITALKYFVTYGVREFAKALFIPRGKVYYTNFEICRVDFFSSAIWQNFYSKIDESGGFYLHRWGDHIFRYLGVNVLLKRQQRLPIPNGFTYQHGGIFHSEDKASIRPHWLSRTKV